MQAGYVKPSNVMKNINCLLATIISFSVMLLPLHSKTEGLARKIKAFAQGPSDTVVILRPAIKTFAAYNGGTVLTCQDITREKAILSLINPVKGKVWEKNYERLIRYRLTSSEVSAPKLVVGYGLQEGHSVTEIYRCDGTQIAKIDDKTVLGTSANGAYFFSLPSWLVYNPLNVYDSLGNRLWTRKTHGGYWESATLSDSEVLYWDPEKLLILDAKSGQVIVELSNEQFREFEIPPLFAVSRNGEYFSIFTNKILLSFSRRGELLWKSKFDRTSGALADVAYSPDGERIGLTLIPQGKGTHRLLKFIDNFEAGSSLCSIEIETDCQFISGPVSTMTLWNDLATVILPSSYEVYASTGKGITSATKSLILLFDSSGRIITDSLTTEGIFSLGESQHPEVYPIRLLESNEKNILMLKPVD